MEIPNETITTNNICEPWEKQGHDVFYLEPIPGRRRRWLNPEIRAKRPGGYIKETGKEARKLGDLVSGYMPIEKAKKRDAYYASKSITPEKKEQEKQAELMRTFMGDITKRMT